jgi:heat shock protein HslJ
MTGIKDLKRSRHVSLAAVAVVTTAALAACGTATGSGGGAGGGGGGQENGGNDASIVGVRWVPESVTVDGQEHAQPRASSGAYLVFKPGTTDNPGGESGGSSGCNDFGADARIEGDTIRVTDLASTKMACAGQVGQFEEHLVHVFTGAHHFEVSESGDALTLMTRDGDSLALVRAAAEGS